MLAPQFKDQSREQLISILASSTQTSKAKNTSTKIYWNESFYGLSKSKIYTDLPEDKKHEILYQLNQKGLCLSYFIEKYGLNYGAKMVLSSETVEEKSLYTVFGADEVRHRLLLEPFIQMQIPDNIEFHPLLPLLALTLEEANKEATTFVIQVVLEGFGIYHYANLRDACQSEELKNAYTEILKDEVNHHGMGVCLTANKQMTTETKQQITELTSKFVRALIKTEWTQQSVEAAYGGFSVKQKQDFLKEISWQEQMQLRVERLKALMKKVGFAGLVDDLEAKGVFQIN